MEVSLALLLRCLLRGVFIGVSDVCLLLGLLFGVSNVCLLCGLCARGFDVCLLFGLLPRGSVIFLLLGLCKGLLLKCVLFFFGEDTGRIRNLSKLIFAFGDKSLFSCFSSLVSTYSSIFCESTSLLISLFSFSVFGSRMLLLP